MRWASEQQLSNRRLCTYIGAALMVAFGFGTAPVLADGSIDAWASWALAPKVWKGQTVLAPEPEARPSGAFERLDALDLPLHVHVPAQSSDARALRILNAGRAAFHSLQALAWPLPELDGGRGETQGIDLYVVPRNACAAACAGIDGPLALSDFDAAESFSSIAGDLPNAELESCALSALAQAGLRAVDPSEALSWVRASAELAVWIATGQFGCDASLVEAQHAPERGLLNTDPRSGAAGALFLGVLSERLEPTQQTPGEWVRQLWETTRQRSRGLVANDRLRSSPDLWEVLRQTLETLHLTLEDELIEFSVARYFAGPASQRTQAPYRLLAALPSDAGVPVRDVSLATTSAVQLHDPTELSSLGSAYVRVRLPAPARSHELQVWLRGELGPRWSLTAVRLDAAGHELGRTSAPPRNVPNSYVPVAIDDETRDVVLVIVNLPEATPDADVIGPGAHGYELIVSLSG